MEEIDIPIVRWIDGTAFSDFESLRKVNAPIVDYVGIYTLDWANLDVKYNIPDKFDTDSFYIFYITNHDRCNWFYQEKWYKIKPQKVR